MIITIYYLPLMINNSSSQNHKNNNYDIYSGVINFKYTFCVFLGLYLAMLQDYSLLFTQDYSRKGSRNYMLCCTDQSWLSHMQSHAPCSLDPEICVQMKFTFINFQIRRFKIKNHCQIQQNQVFQYIALSFIHSKAFYKMLI